MSQLTCASTMSTYTPGTGKLAIMSTLVLDLVQKFKSIESIKMTIFSLLRFMPNRLEDNIFLNPIYLPVSRIRQVLGRAKADSETGYKWFRSRSAHIRYLS